MLTVTTVPKGYECRLCGHIADGKEDYIADYSLRDYICEPCYKRESGNELDNTDMVARVY